MASGDGRTGPGDFPWVAAAAAWDGSNTVRVTIDPSFEFDNAVREKVWRHLQNFQGEELTQACLGELEHSLSSLLRESVLRGQGRRKPRAV